MRVSLLLFLGLVGGVPLVSAQTATETDAAITAAEGETLALTDARIVSEYPRSPGLVARSGASVTLIGGTVKTTEGEAPALVSQGAMSVSDSVLTAARSVVALVEGRGILTVKDSALVASRTGALILAPGSSSETGAANATFSMSGGSFTGLAGALVEVATRGVVTLKQVTVVHPEGPLVRVAEGAWLTLNADNQSLVGELSVGATGTLRVFLRNGSTWVGTTDLDPTAAEVNVTLETGSVWTLAADARVSALRTEGGTAALVSRSVVTAGHTLWYRSTDNNWLGGRTIAFPDGGSLQPY